MLTNSVKAEGDGAEAQRNTNVNLLNVALLQSHRIYSTEGREIVACINGKDCYELWQKCAAVPIGQINQLEQEKKIEVDGKTYTITIWLGGDYKFLLETMGMNAANGAYACVFCYVHAVRAPCTCSGYTGGGTKFLLCSTPLY